jgi:hypothetical protein
MSDEAIVIRDELVSDGFADYQRVEAVEVGFAALVYCAVPKKPPATYGFRHASGKGRQGLEMRRQEMRRQTGNAST